ncbi:MAG: VCBS repeat-containing protein [Myxococcota bacterium]
MARPIPDLHRQAAVGLLACVAGCVGVAYDPPTSPSRWVEAGAVDALEGLPASGSAPLRVVVRAVNLFGAAVPAPDLAREVELDGVSVPVALDGFGYGAVTVDAVGAARLEGFDAPEPAFEVHALPPWPGLPLQRAWPAPVDAPEIGVAGASGGLAAADGEVWWVGDGAPPHRVLDAGREILGLRARNIDVDGVLDAVAWTSDRVFLLRGRSGGGMGWVGALEAEGRSVAGVDVGDLSGDNLPDLAVAWVDEAGRGLLDVLEGDGLFRFTAAQPRTLPGKPTSLVIADNTGEGIAQVTVLQEEGDWARFVLGGVGDDGVGRYIPVGPRAPVSTLAIPFGSALLPTGDVNGDDGAEITIAAPRYDGEGRDMWFVDVATDAVACASGATDAQCGTQFLGLEQEPGAWLDVFDANGDYHADILLERDDRPEGVASLVVVAVDPLAPTESYTKARILDLPDYGPMAWNDFDRDGSGDLFLAAGPAWRRWQGRGFADVERFWEPVLTPLAVAAAGVEGPLALLEADGDPGTIEAVVGLRDGGDTLVRLLRYPVGGGVRATNLGQVVVGTGGPVDDLAVCDGDVFVTASGHTLRLAASDAGLTVAADVATGADRVACGEGPDGATVATLESGRVQLRNRALGAIGAAEDAAGAGDVALGVVAGVARVATCVAPCGAAYWPLGADGVFALGDAERLVVDAGQARRVPGSGEPAIADVDGDGRLDLVAYDEARHLLSVFRSDGEGVPLPELFHTERALLGPVSFADGDGDGVPDLWSVYVAETETEVVYVPQPGPAEDAVP